MLSRTHGAGKSTLLATLAGLIPPLAGGIVLTPSGAVRERVSLALQFAVVHVPFLQKAFSTVSLNAGDWLRCAAVASSVLWLRELGKIAERATGNLGRRRRKRGEAAQ